MSSNSRRTFIKQIAGTAAYGIFYSACNSPKQIIGSSNSSFFEISLAEWSLHKSLFAKKITNLDFPSISKNQYGISVVEYVNAFFKDKAQDTTYLNELLKRCNDNGVKNHLIMCDGEGDLGDLDQATRMKAVENHYKWVDAAKHLGCTSIRVNAFGKGSPEEVQ
ncbi:MAG: sugar phosphate isomerase/epimerase, partial [Flavisolibacter sp.]